MKKNNLGSILIWSIFFMISIFFSFLYISTVIKKEIDLNENIFTQEKKESYFEKTFTGILLNLEKKQIMLSNTGTIKLISGGPILINTGTLLTNTGTLSPGTYLLSNLGGYSNYTINILPNNIKNIEKKYKKIDNFFIFSGYEF